MVSSDRRKLAMLLYLQEERGFSMEVASRTVLALMPLDDAVRPPGATRRQLVSSRNSSPKASKHSDPGESDRLATRTLEELRILALDHGDSYYAERYNTALTT